jgi:hypothetical protein
MCIVLRQDDTRIMSYPKTPEAICASLCLSTAVAVGSLSAVKHFFSILAPTEWLEMYVYFNFYAEQVDAPLLSDPLLAAVSTGKIAVVQHILSMVSTELGRHKDRPTAMMMRVSTAIAVAIRTKSVFTIRLLTEFAETELWGVGDRHFDDVAVRSPSVLETWLVDVARSGCFALCRAVSIALSVLSNEPMRRWINRVYELSCKYGATQLLHCMLSRKRVAMQIEHTSDSSSPESGQPATHWQRGVVIATRYGRTQVIAMLLNHGANIDLFDPLIEAVRDGRLEMVKLMLERGAKINLSDPSIEAVRNGSLEIVKLMLERGAQATDTFGGDMMNYHGLKSFGSDGQLMSYYIVAKVAAEDAKVAASVATAQSFNRPARKRFARLIMDVEQSIVWNTMAQEIMRINATGEALDGMIFTEYLVSRNAANQD